MATPLVHLNPTHFSDPLSFYPERFIEDPRLKRNLMSFSQGSRQCLGMQLAFAELYLVNSAIWRRFGSKEDKGDAGWLELFETDKTDVEMVADMFVVRQSTPNFPILHECGQSRESANQFRIPQGYMLTWKLCLAVSKEGIQGH